MIKRRLLFAFLMIILLLPLWLWLGWLFTPSNKLVVAIIDKTVLNQKDQEHISLTWILNNHRFTKAGTQRYKVNHDYYGFFPGDSGKYKIKGLERFSSEQLNRLSTDADVAYFTDTYGVYKNDWYSGKDNGNRQAWMIYGGMSAQDIEFLQDMKARHKLIITEFNTIGAPTSADNRNKFERLFGMHWTGWVGRHFESLDTSVSKEIPRWLINSYMRQHHRTWPYHKAGVAFVNTEDVVVILEEGTHLASPVPDIITAAYGQKKLSLPAEIDYPYWFDVISPEIPLNHIVSRFAIKVNANGAKELKKYDIPQTFPAIIMHNDKDYRFYYFSGDFCDNPIGLGTSYFRGVGAFKWFFYNGGDPSERRGFFWSFYKPMMSEILEENLREKIATKSK